MRERVFSLSAVAGFAAMLMSTVLSAAFLSGYGGEALTALFWIGALWTGLVGLAVAGAVSLAQTFKGLKGGVGRLRTGGLGGPGTGTARA